jgi:hypothetical protein
MVKLNDDKVVELMEELANAIIECITDRATAAEARGSSEEDFNAAVYATVTALVAGFEDGMDPATLDAVKALLSQDKI